MNSEKNVVPGDRGCIKIPMAILSIIAILILTLPAQGRVKIEKARNIEGISNNSVLSILQDRMGYIWMGSYDGLNRYDGKRVDVFRFELNNPAGLSGNVIGEIFPSQDENIWVLTSMGLDRFSTKSLKATAHFPHIRADRQLMAADTVGDAFVFSPDGSLSRLDRKKMRFVKTQSKGLPAYKNVKKLLLDGRNSLLIICKDGKAKKIAYGSSPGHNNDNHFMSLKEITVSETPFSTVIPGKAGFYFTDDKGKLFYFDYSSYKRRYIADLRNLPYGRISGIAPLGGNLVIGFYGIGTGVLYGPENRRFEMLSSEVGTFSVMSDRRQPLVWVASDGGGLYKIYDADTRYHSINSAVIPGLSKPIRCFNTDGSGNLWIGTKGNGLFRINKYKSFVNTSSIPAESIKRFDERDGLPDNQVFAISDSRFHPDRKWIATRGPGISYIEPGREKIHNIHHPGILDIHDVYEQNDSVLWLASTSKGLIRAVISSRNGIETIAPDKISSFEFRLDPYVCNEIHSMAFDGDSTLYIGCRGGLGIVAFNIFNYKYSFISGITRRFPAIGDVISLFYSEDSRLYFGSSAGAGILDCGSPGAEPRILTHKDGMINDMAHSIIRDRDGMVWISTNKGLVRFDPQNNQIHNITDFEGSIIEFCDNAGYISPTDGNIFFGALNGVVRIAPDELKKIPVSAPTPFYFNAIQINGRDRNLYELMEGNGRLSLASDENTIKISFAALDFIKGDDFNYYYKLEGHDNEWINLGTTPAVTFTNLPPGDYVLKVTYRSDSVQTPEESYSLPLTIRAPWYLSTIAIIVYVLIAIGATLSGIYLVRKYYRKKRKEFEMKLYAHQQEQLYSDRMEFFQSITHELCTPLTMIMGLCDRLRSNTGKLHDDKLERYIDSLRHHSSQLNDLIQEILDIRQMQSPDFQLIRVQPVKMETIFTKWVFPFGEMAAENGITFETSLDNPDLRWNTDAPSIGKIFTNLISNALKYTPEKGTVKVDCRLEGEELHFSVYNTGEGIPKEKLATLFDKYTMFRNADRNGYTDIASRHGLGLYICKGLVERLHGNISVESAPGEYTRFDVKLPKLDVSRKEIANKGNDSRDVRFTDTEKRPGILVVDDNPDILWLVSDILSDRYDVITASGVGEAFEKIKQDLPSLIITDLMMPDTDGIEFTAELRKNRYTKHIPILILSAKLTENQKIEGYASGADEYMTKPFSAEFLRVVVERMINRKESDRNYYHSSQSAVTIQDGIEITNEDKEFFDRLKQYIIDNIEDENKLKPGELADAMGMELRTLYRKFKKSSPFTPTEMVKNYRYSYAARLLLTTNMTIQEIIYKTGVSNKTIFYADFKKIYGMTPKEYRESGGSKSKE